MSWDQRPALELCTGARVWDGEERAPLLRLVTHVQPYNGRIVVQYFDGHAATFDATAIVWSCLPTPRAA